MKVKSESEVGQLCPTLSDPMDCSPPGSSTHGIFQVRVLEWADIAFSASPLLVSPTGQTPGEVRGWGARGMQSRLVNLQRFMT